MNKSKLHLCFASSLIGVIFLLTGQTLYAQKSSVQMGSVQSKDSIFKQRMPVAIVPDTQKAAQHYIQLVDHNKRNLYPDRVKVKMKYPGSNPKIAYTKEGKVSFEMNRLDQEGKIKVVVGRYKTTLGTHKRKVFLLSPWEAAMRGVYVPVGKTKNFLGMKRVCPKL